MDPRDPNRLYAATWQRHRNVAAYMGGGPGTGLHRSTDGGETWEKLSRGLPKSDMGKIGLAISPQRPDVLYAAIELDRRTGGVYRSTDRGSTWEKRSQAVAGATGPHYYQELYACPHEYGRLYLVDVRMQVSDDDGKTFRRMQEEHKHSDNHAIAFRKDDPDYLLVGTDGGLYESFDLAQNWRFMANLPLTQYYKVAVDDAEPFYNIYGGTQDNNTQGGPSRTDNVHGIQNSDWRVVLNWDGHQPATEPGNPNIMYGERQEGNLSRIDLATGEVIDIQPQPGVDEDFERFNWDAPILVSPHAPTRIYFASQRLWRSDNRGDVWTPVSGDLTRNEERIALPIMGGQQSWDAPWDFLAMSNYNTITSISESPLQEGMLYVGTDDGLIQISEDGGNTWRKIEVGSIPGVPRTAFVNDIKADLHDAKTVYVCLDNHKFGDFRPYLVKSSDGGKSWSSLSSDLPDRLLLWRIVQDHESPGLFFLATEFGVYFTVNGGERWIRIMGGAPTISFRDLAIQRRENDLVAASFGRSFFVLDDYTPLRAVNEEQLRAEATLFEPKDAWWYVPRPQLSFDNMKGSQGAAHYVAPNPPFGAVFSYYLKEELKTAKNARRKDEKALKEAGQDVPFPGWDAVENEERTTRPEILLVVRDSDGNVVRRLKGDTKAGIHRTAWDLRYPAPQAIRPGAVAATGTSAPKGMMAAPGEYTVVLAKKIDGKVTELSSPLPFNLIPLLKGSLPGASHTDVAAFWRAYENAVRRSSATSLALGKARSKASGMKDALARSLASTGDLDQEVQQIVDGLHMLDVRLNGYRSKSQVGEKNRPNVGTRLFAIQRGVEHSTYGPTASLKNNLNIINDELNDIGSALENFQRELSILAKKLIDAGAPWIEGEALPGNNH